MLGFSGIQAYGHIVLNALRALNVIGLLAAATGCGIVVAKTTVLGPDGWWFFDTVSFIFSALTCVFLIISEVPVLDVVRRYFRNNWPVLSNDHGLSWLAVVMIAISFHILGAPYNEKREITGPFRSAVLAGGILCLLTAFITLVGSMLFADRKHGISARSIRSNGALASSKSILSTRSQSTRTTPTRNDSARSGLARNRLTRNHPRRNNSAPSKTAERDVTSPFPPAPPPTAANNSRRSSFLSARGTTEAMDSAAMSERDSSPAFNAPGSWISTSPIVPGLRRPDTALHPMNLNANAGRYSEASHLNRF